MTQHIRTTVRLSASLAVDVSTIDLSMHGVEFLTGIETGLFWTWADGRTDNDIVARYASWDEAQAGHAAWCNESVLAFVTGAMETYAQVIAQTLDGLSA